MKTQNVILSFCIVLFSSITVFGQKAGARSNDKKESIKVWGNCGMCKKTIESAAMKAGATAADWNTETKILAVSYRSNKTTNDKIQQAVAAAGYDTKDFTAPDEAYQKLHSCCQYDRKAAATTSTQNCCAGDKCGKDTACCKDAKCCDGKEACADVAACKDKGCCSKS